MSRGSCCAHHRQLRGCGTADKDFGMGYQYDVIIEDDEVVVE